MPNYNKTWLLEYLLNNEDFNSLFDHWVKSGYEANLVPSIDWIDSSLPYLSTNIQVLTWQENNLKGISERYKDNICH